MDPRIEALVWKRAGNRCEYCHFPAEFTRVPFQIDHVIAEKHRGKTVLDNLALACFFCNTFKGPNVAGIDPETSQITRLFHPRLDRWSKHFRWKDAAIIGKTSIGRTTIEVLRMNDPDALAVRESLLEEGLLAD